MRIKNMQSYENSSIHTPHSVQFFFKIQLKIVTLHKIFKIRCWKKYKNCLLK